MKSSMTAGICCRDGLQSSPESQPSRPVRALRKCSPKKRRAKPPSHIRFPQQPQASWSLASRFSKPEDAAELKAIFDCSSDHYPTSMKLRVRKSNSTIDAMKVKIKEHLTRDFSRAKSRSTSSKGLSREESARREELRSIRRKRIQEELSNGIVYDDDAKSLSSVASLALTAPVGASAGSRSSRYDSIMFPTFEWTQSTPLKPEKLALIHPNLLLDSYEARRTISEPDESIRFGILPAIYPRSHSLPSLSSEPILHQTHHFLTAVSPKRTIPNAPALKPIRLPSIGDDTTRRSSWRLSFTSENRAADLRALSQDFTASKIPPTLPELPSIPSFRRWLKGQGFTKSSDAVDTSISEDHVNIGSFAPCHSMCNPDQAFGGVDGGQDLPCPIPLHRLDISRRLLSAGLTSSTSSPELSNGHQSPHQRPLSSLNGTSHNEITVPSPISTEILESMGVQEANKLLENVIRQETSSLYHSSAENLSLAAKNPKLDLTRLFVPKNRRAGPPASSDSKSSTNMKTVLIEEGQPSALYPQFPAACYASHGDHRSSKSLVIPLHLSRPGSAVDGKSISPSETSTTRQRESELTVLKSQMPIIQGTGTFPRTSRFRETFDVMASPRNSVSSLSRRQKSLVSVSFDGPSDGPGSPTSGRFRFRSSAPSMVSPGAQVERYSILGGHEAAGAYQSASLDSPPAEDSAAAMWEKALRTTAEERRRKVSAALARSSSHKKSRDSNIKGSLQGQFKFLEGVFTESRRRENRLTELNDWIKELRAQELQAWERSRPVVDSQKQKGRAVTYPEAWAQFPSHSRERRNGAANAFDGVETRDFSIKQVNDSGEIIWATSERKHFLQHHDHHEQYLRRHSLPVRIKKHLRSTVYKLRTRIPAHLNEPLHGHGRRTSITYGGNLDYPELELLTIAGGPESTTKVTALEREVAEALKVQEQLKQIMTFSDGCDERNLEGSLRGFPHGSMDKTESDSSAYQSHGIATHSDSTRATHFVNQPVTDHCVTVTDSTDLACFRDDSSDFRTGQPLKLPAEQGIGHTLCEAKHEEVYSRGSRYR